VYQDVPCAVDMGMSPNDRERPLNRATAFRSATAGFVVATLVLLMLHMLLA
jgi:hypothetical protein